MRGRALHLLRNVLIVPDTGTCSIVVGAGASSPPHHSSNCFQENVQDLERVNITYICTTLVGLYRPKNALLRKISICSIYCFLCITYSQFPRIHQPGIFMLHLFFRLLKQQIAMFVPYNFLSKLSTDIVTFSNKPAANIWYFLSPSPLPLTNPPSTTRQKALTRLWAVLAFCPLYYQFSRPRNILLSKRKIVRGLTFDS